jgi:hypothetical protein
MKKSQNSRNLGFSYYFCLMMMEGSVPLTDPEGPNSYGSGGTGAKARTSALAVALLCFRI